MALGEETESFEPYSGPEVIRKTREKFTSDNFAENFASAKDWEYVRDLGR